GAMARGIPFGRGNRRPEVDSCARPQRPRSTSAGKGGRRNQQPARSCNRFGEEGEIRSLLLVHPSSSAVVLRRREDASGLFPQVIVHIARRVKAQSFASGFD